MRTGVWASCFWLNELRWPFTSRVSKLHNEDWEVEELCGIFATLSRASWCFCHIQWKDGEVFFLHGHETNVLKQIENKQPVQTSFRCVLSRMQFHFTEAATYVSVLDVGNIRSEMHAWTHFFISRKAWFKVGTKQKQRQHGKHVRLLFPFWFAGAKVGPWVTDCAFEWKGLF